MKNEIDIGRLREIFYFDAESGTLRYRARRSAKKAGSIAGYVNNFGYRVVMIDYRPFLAHRVIWAILHNEWPEPAIDHRDMNKDNNRADNLRLASRTLNGANRPTVRNGLKGAYKHRDRFVAAIKKNGKYYHLGVFDSEQSAHRAYCQKALEFFGEYARFE